MIESIVSIFSSGGIGAIVGAVTSWATKREERKSLQMRLNHEHRMGELNRQFKLDLADKEIDRAAIEGEWSAFVESQKGQYLPSGSAFGDAIRGVIRPLITLWLMAVMTYWTYQLTISIGGIQALPADKMLDLYTDIIGQVFMLTNLAVSWYFGSRPSSQRKVK